MSIRINPPAASLSWLWKMAWRDSRRSRQRLFLFMSSIVLGIAALVGINAFGDNLARSLDQQARELLGADLTLSSSRPLTRPLQRQLQSLGQERTREVSFASMVAFPKTGNTRLAQIRAFDGNFPYYGAWEVQPLSAVASFRQANQSQLPEALVDESLLTQFGVQVGDSVKVGNLKFRVAGRVQKTPGQSVVVTSVAPTVFIPTSFLTQTGLVQLGSRTTYRYYYRLKPGQDVDTYAKRLETQYRKFGISADTVARRKKQTGRAFDDLTKFLNLVAFVALLLGCVGVASSVNVYVKEKVRSVAVLRCLGASGWQAFFIYLIQTAVMGLLGAVIGALLGSGVQLLLPKVLGNFLPIAVDITLSWSAIGQGIGIGLLIAFLFALLPLLSIRRVSPLRTLRSAYDDDQTDRSDWGQWLVYGLILLGILGFSFLQVRDWKLALSFTGGLLVTFALLTGMAQLMIVLVRRFFPTGWSYVWRQSLANLYRPNNQTLILVTAIGLGTFLIATLYQTQSLLLSRLQLSSSGKQPNMVLFDIQNEQQAGVKQLMTSRGLPVLQEVPVVTMRLAGMHNRSLEALRKDTAAHYPDWAFNREYRVTYRDSLISSEKLRSGRSPYMQDNVAHVSIETGLFEQLKLKLGDTLTFNVQGALIPVIVGGSREVDWQRVQTNFLVVFPRGVLDQAPQFHVLMTRVPDNRLSATFQRDLVSQYPNVSAIDLGLVLKTLDEILGKISFVIQFMALFSMITGLLVLGSSIIISKYQRIQESVLLRTLGASRGQILRITLIEYGFLGTLAAVSGIALALIASWALARFVFEVPFTAQWAPLALMTGLIAGLTMLIGALNSRDVLVRPPLEVLRAEA